MSFVINKDATFTWVGYEFLLMGGAAFCNLNISRGGKNPMKTMKTAIASL